MYNTEGEWEAHDITAVTDEEIRGLARERKIDIITGGFPCQSFSIAGKRLGFADTRGNIFFEICRFIRIIQPRYFICENVKGLLSHDGGRTFGTILRTLAELGYCVEWQILNSKNFGVPQNRERVFLIGHFRDRRGGKVFPFRRADSKNPCELQEITSGVKDAYRIYNADGIARTLKSEGGGLGAKTGLYAVNTLLTIKKDKCKGSCSNLKVKRIGDDTAATIAARYYKGLSADGCNGVICIQKTQGDTTTVKVDETGTLQAARLDKVPNVIAAEAQDRKGVAIKETGGKLDAGIFPGVRIRRLTPRECWRLQGFPDEYFDRAQAAGLSDTQLYKQAGNAVTVNVAAAIGRRLAEIGEEESREQTERRMIPRTRFRNRRKWRQ